MRLPLGLFQLSPRTGSLKHTTLITYFNIFTVRTLLLNFLPKGILCLSGFKDFQQYLRGHMGIYEVPLFCAKDVKAGCNINNKCNSIYAKHVGFNIF